MKIIERINKLGQEVYNLDVKKREAIANLCEKYGVLVKQYIEYPGTKNEKVYYDYYKDGVFLFRLLKTRVKLVPVRDEINLLKEKKEVKQYLCLLNSKEEGNDKKIAKLEESMLVKRYKRLVKLEKTGIKFLQEKRLIEKKFRNTLVKLAGVRCNDIYEKQNNTKENGKEK